MRIVVFPFMYRYTFLYVLITCWTWLWIESIENRTERISYPAWWERQGEDSSSSRDDDLLTTVGRWELLGIKNKQTFCFYCCIYNRHCRRDGRSEANCFGQGIPLQPLLLRSVILGYITTFLSVCVLVYVCVFFFFVVLSSPYQHSRFAFFHFFFN